MTVTNHITDFYYINLDRRIDRRNNIEKQILSSTILSKSLNRFTAIDGYEININDQANKKFITENGKKDILENKIKSYGITLTYGSLACAISHYSLFEKCISTKNGNILIFEDDIIIPSNIDKYIDIIENIEFYYDIFYLGMHDLSTNREQIPNTNICWLKGYFWGAFAYVLTPRACEFIVHNVFPLSIQFDSVIGQKVRDNQLKVMCFKKDIIQCGQFGTDNQGLQGLRNSTRVCEAWDQVFN